MPTNGIAYHTYSSHHRLGHGGRGNDTILRRLSNRRLIYISDTIVPPLDGGKVYVVSILRSSLDQGG